MNKFLCQKKIYESKEKERERDRDGQIRQRERLTENRDRDIDRDGRISKFVTTRETGRQKQSK